MAVVSKTMPVSYDFSGKTAVVTGGSKGIGRAIRQQLKLSAAQVWNWDVIAAQLDGVNFEKVDTMVSRSMRRFPRSVASTFS